MGDARARVRAERVRSGRPATPSADSSWGYRDVHGLSLLLAFIEQVFEHGTRLHQMVAVQGSMLGLGSEVEISSLEVGLDRAELGKGAWLEVRRGWIQGGDVVFSHLTDAVPWRAERRPMYDRVVDVPRLLAFYDIGEPLPDGALVEMREALRRHYRNTPGGDLATAGFCLYRDGHDSVAWHGDRIGRGSSDDVVVAIISFGASRAFHVRPRDGGRALRFVLDSGDLFVMGGSCQRTFDHCVPKTSRAVGARISVQFRGQGVR